MAQLQKERVAATQTILTLRTGLHRRCARLGDRSYQSQLEPALHPMPEMRFVSVPVGSYDKLLDVRVPSPDTTLYFVAIQLRP